MKNFVFGLLLLLFTSNVALGQKRTITDLGVETIEYGEIAKYVYDGNPFNDNEKSLTILPTTENNYPIPWGAKVYNYYFLKVSKSDLHPDVIDVYMNMPGKNNPHTFNWEFIFDDDRGTYLKIDGDYLKNIKTLDHELFLKFKKHKKVTVRVSLIYYATYTKPEKIHSFKDKIYDLTGFTAAYNKYMGIQPPTLKNKNVYKVVNGLANVNPFNLDRYIDKFILDASTNHNIDLSYVNKRKKLILFRELDGQTIAAAYKMNDDDSVLVLVDPENWYDANQAKRWYIIYHELGHDILNLEHGECGPMMNETTSGNYSWDRLEKDKNIMFEKYKSKQ